MCSDPLKTSPDTDGKFQTVILSESSSPEATSEINITHENNVFILGNYCEYIFAGLSQLFSSYWTSPQNLSQCFGKFKYLIK